MICKKCGAKIDDENRFCGKCGAPAEAEQGFIDLSSVRHDGRTARRRPGRINVLFFAAGIVLLGAALGALVWAATGPRPAARQFARGERYLAEGSCDKAAGAFSRAVESGYNGAAVYLGLADAHMEMDDTQGAIGFLHQGLAAVPEPGPIVDRLLSIARDFLAEGNYAGVVAALEGVADAVPEHVDAYLLLADGYAGTGDADKAAETLDEGYAHTGSEDISAAIDARAEPRGNTPGNISNAGFAAERDGWVYYCNFRGDLRIYRSRFDGTERTRLVVNGFFINVIDDWIYFSDFDDMTICRVRTDGAGLTEVADDIATYLNVVGEWIYYAGGPENGLYKIRTDGTGRTLLSDDACSYINAAGGWIFYRNDADGGKLYKIRTDGTERTKLSDSECGYINVAGDWVYYCKGRDSGELYRMRTDGTQKTRLLYDECGSVNVTGGWIYFSNKSDYGNLYKIRTDGAGQTKILEDMCSSLSIAGDWIYYIGQNDAFYRVRTDGTDRQWVRY